MGSKGGDNSVGKISMGLEVVGDSLEKQITDMATAFQKQISDVGVVFQNTMEDAIQRPIDVFSKAMDKFVGDTLPKQIGDVGVLFQDTVENSIQQPLDAFSKAIDEFIGDTSARLKRTVKKSIEEAADTTVKLPPMDFVQQPSSATSGPAAGARDIPRQAPTVTPEVNLKPAEAQTKAFSDSVRQELNGTAKETARFAEKTCGSVGGNLKKLKSFFSERLGLEAKQGVKETGDEVEEMSAKFGGSVKKMEEKMASLSSGADKTKISIKELETSMAELLAEQDAIARRYAEMPPTSGLTKDESMEKFLATDTRYRKLSAEIETLELKLKSLGERNRQTAEEMGVLGNAIDRVKEAASQASGANEQLRRSSSRAGQSSERASRQISRAGSAAQRTSRHITSVGNSSQKAQGKVASFATSMQRAFARVLRQVFVFAVLYKAIRGMQEYIGSALQTNQEFTNSLNQVKTNLQVAFMPIYQAVLPALNTLMAGLAKATAYIASFTSALFGKTYKQSFKAVQNLNAAKKSIEGAGKAAKKVVGSLAAFDEINILSEPKDEDETGGSGLVAPPMDMDAIDQDMTGLADKVKSIFATAFQPFKAAWENEGAATVDAAKYALSGIWALTKEIGKSFAEVWTNGTGQAILEALLRILQQILGLVGDIGFTFAHVWTEGGRGTAIVQGIANIFLHLLELLERIGKSLRHVWGEIGEGVTRTFLDIIGATVDVLENLAEKLVWVWDHGGQHLFESFIKLGAKIFEIAGEIYTEFVAPFVSWFIDEIAPVVASVLDTLAPVLDELGDKLLYVWNNGGKVLFENLVRAIKAIIKIALPFIELIITKVLAPLVMWLLDKIAPALSWLLDKVGWILGKIADFFEWLYDVLIGNSIIPDLINGIKTWFENLVEWVTAPVKKLVEGVVKLWEDIKTQATNIFGKIKDTITGVFDTVKTKVLDIWDTITSKLTNAFNSIYNKAKDIFGRMKNFIGDICDSIKGFFKNMVNGVIRALNGMIGGLNKLKFDVPDWVPGMGGKHFGFNLPKIPQLARGGIVDQPTLAMIGEKRKKEAVVPLEDTSFVDKIAEAVANAVLSAMQMLGGQGNDSDGDRELIVEIDGVKLARILLPKTDAELRRRGARSILQPV